MLLKHVLRQRNAVVHGIKPVPAVVATIDRFLARLSPTWSTTRSRASRPAKNWACDSKEHRTTAQRRMWRLGQPGVTTRRALFNEANEDPASAPAGWRRRT